MKFRRPRKQLTKEQAAQRLEIAKQSRGNYSEHLFCAKYLGIPPLILALCRTTIEEEIEICKERISYLDEAIAYYKSILQQ